MDIEKHKDVIERQKKLGDRNEQISGATLGRLDLRMILQKRSQARRYFIQLILKYSDALFSEMSALGREFGQHKIREFNAGRS